MSEEIRKKVIEIKEVKSEDWKDIDGARWVIIELPKTTELRVTRVDGKEQIHKLHNGGSYKLNEETDWITIKYN
jgi:hypothetical protein